MADFGRGALTSAPPQAPGLVTSLGDLYESLKALDERLATLTSMLTPVLSDMPGSPATKENPLQPPSSPAERLLQDSINYAHVLRMMVDDLQQRLRL